MALEGGNRQRLFGILIKFLDPEKRKKTRRPVGMEALLGGERGGFVGRRPYLEAILMGGDRNLLGRVSAG
jgi:hypothetical protein